MSARRLPAAHADARRAMELVKAAPAGTLINAEYSSIKLLHHIIHLSTFGISRPLRCY